MRKRFLTTNISLPTGKHNVIVGKKKDITALKFSVKDRSVYLYYAAQAIQLFPKVHHTLNRKYCKVISFSDSRIDMQSVATDCMSILDSFMKGSFFQIILNNNLLVPDKRPTYSQGEGGDRKERDPG